MTEDHAGKTYWDDLWETGASRHPPRGPADLDHVERQFAALFERLLTRAGSEPHILEIGCARSIWLPYLARSSDAQVTGIDYSEVGCAQARELLEQAGLRGEVVCADAFDPPPELLRTFDLVFSFGVVEHFGDTDRAVAAFARYLRPGGFLVTIVPNMKGVVGVLERLINPRVYAIHERLSPADLERAAARAHLVEIRSRYFVSTNFGILNLVGLQETRSTRAKRLGLRALTKASVWAWRLERVIRLPATRVLAGYVVCEASAPVEPERTNTN